MKPTIKYTRRINLGNYEHMELDMQMEASSNSVEEINATTDFVIATVEHKLKKESHRAYKSRGYDKAYT